MNRYEIEIAENYARVLEKIAEAAKRGGSDPSAIKVVGVTKSHSPEIVDAGIKAGLKIIGENRVQEAEKKLPLLSEPYEEFHYIGHLQKNKINKLLALKPALIQSIDKLTTAESLNRSLEREDRKQSILIQVNTSGEESKYGVPADYGELKELIYRISLLERLKIRGLMTIGKFTDEEAEIRKCFSLLRNYYESLNEEGISGVVMEVLSMGMSNDYQIAVEEGANLVRIGTALYGIRHSSQ
jgi:hypothetical protein